MRALSIAVLVLALAAPAHAAPFGKPRTLGTTPPEYEYDSVYAAPGPSGGVTFYFAAEKQVELTITHRLFITRVEGNGRTHALTSTPIKDAAPARAYDGGPPFSYLAVGPRWRMLTTEVRATGPRETAVYGVQLAPNGRRVAEQLLGPEFEARGNFGTNERGDAIAGHGNGFMIARSAGRFVRAPDTLRQIDDRLPRLAADGSLYALRRTDDGSLGVAYSTGRRWGEVQSIFTAAQGQAVYYADLASSANGDALLVYGIGDDIFNTNLVARWSRRGRPFGAPVELTPHVDPNYVGIEAVPRGRFAVRWFDGNGILHLLRARGRGRPFREVATWRAPADVSFRTFLPLADGRTLLAWSTQDRNFVEPERLLAAVVDAKGKIGPAQRIAVGDLGGFALRRVGANRGALVWTERRKGTKRLRIVLTGR